MNALLINTVCQIINETNINDDLKIQLTHSLLAAITVEIQGQARPIQEILDVYQWDLLKNLLSEIATFTNPDAQNALVDVKLHSILIDQWNEFLIEAHATELDSLDDDEEYSFEDFVANESCDLLDNFLDDLDTKTLTLGLLDTITSVSQWEDYHVVAAAILPKF